MNRTAKGVSHRAAGRPAGGSLSTTAILAALDFGKYQCTTPRRQAHEPAASARPGSRPVISWTIFHAQSRKRLPVSSVPQAAWISHRLADGTVAPRTSKAGA